MVQCQGSKFVEFHSPYKPIHDYSLQNQSNLHVSSNGHASTPKV